MIWLKILALILASAGVAMLAAAYDGKRHKELKGTRALNHASRLFFRISWLALFAFGVWGISWQALHGFSVLFFAFFLVFDPAFNNRTGLRWYYLGTTAKTDELLAGIGGKAMFAAEALLLLAAVWFYVAPVAGKFPF
jgi:hypothetical protein